MSELISQIQDFKDHIIDADIIDPAGVHHELSGGMHGQKVDFGTIPRDGALYEEWVDVNAAFIRSKFPRLPEVIVGVAGGTNKLAVAIAEHFSQQTPSASMKGMESMKDSPNSKSLYLSRWSKALMALIKPELVVVVEDVGTTGSNATQVALEVLETGVGSVEVVNTWKRREHLEHLDEENIPYRAIIDEPLPTYTAEDCVQSGFCAQGWQLIRREK